MVKILIVEDDRPISNLILFNLRKAGYECFTAFDGREASELLEKNHYDLILLDVMLPFVDGFELMEYIKPLGIPVIFITAKSGIEDKLKGLTGGADDYIVKPFEIVELLARINIVLRRYHKIEDSLIYRNIVIKVDEKAVYMDGVIIELKPREYELFLLLVRNAGITLFREKIYGEVWGMEYESDSRTLDLHIQRIRKKLNLKEELKTIFKTGYRLEKADEV